MADRAAMSLRRDPRKIRDSYALPAGRISRGTGRNASVELTQRVGINYGLMPVSPGHILLRATAPA